VSLRSGIAALASVAITPRVPTSLTETTPTSVVIAGSAALVTARLIRTDTRAGVAGQVVRLRYRRVGSTSAYSTFAGTATTTSTGSTTFRTFKPAYSVQVQLFTTNSGAFGGSASPARTIAVGRKITIGSSATRYARGRSFVLHGNVWPSAPRHAVYLQRKSGTRWITLAKVSLDARSDYAFTVRATTPGTFTYRVEAPADTRFSTSFSSGRIINVG